ncbi:RNA polymerase sigma factor [Saccharothrix stipae]
MGSERSRAHAALDPEQPPHGVGGSPPAALADADQLAEVAHAFRDDTGLRDTDDPDVGVVEDAELERLLRREADAELFARVRAAGFTGPEYDILVADLVAYALRVLLPWLRRGRIFAECAARGRGLKHEPWHQARLATSDDDRRELAHETIAEALTLFRRLAVEGRGWTPAGGTALTTYFVGTCVQSFPNVWGRWWREQVPDIPSEDPVGRYDTTGRHLDLDADPARIVTSEVFVDSVLERMPAKVRAVVEPLVRHDWTLVQIAEHLRTTPGAVEQRLRRYRAQNVKHDHSGES